MSSQVMVKSQRKRHLKFKAMFAALPLLILTACGSSQAQPLEKSEEDGLVPVRTTVMPAIGTIPYRVADVNGYFEDQGISVDTTEGIEFSTWIQSLDSQFDIINLTTSTVVQSASAGIDLKTFAGTEAFVEDVHGTVLVTDNPEINSVEDLARAEGRIGVGIASDLTRWNYDNALEGTGLSSENLDLVSVPFGDMADQLRSGAIDAAQAPPGFYEELVADGATILFEAHKDNLVNAGYDLPLAWTLFGSSGSFAENNQEVVEGFQTAIEDASAWVEENPEETLQIYADWVGTDYESVAHFTVPSWKTDIEASDYEPWTELLQDTTLLEEPVDPETLIPSYYGGKE